MSGFFYRTLLFYVVSHAYLFWHVKSAFGKGRGGWLTLPWFAVMGFFPLIFIYLPPDSAVQHGFGLLGNLWRPFAFFCLLAFGVSDGLRVLAWLVRRLFPAFSFSPPNRSCLAMLLLLFCGCAYGYGLYEARTLRVTRLEVPTAKLPQGMDKLRLVFAADLHIGSQIGVGTLQPMVDMILEQKPDSILLGGDILDDALQGTPAEIAELQRLQAPMGVYAVVGNHDAFGDVERSVEFMRQSGFTVLCAAQAEAGPVSIIGVDDPRASEQKGIPSDDPRPLLQKADPSRFVVLLEHQPCIRPDATGLFDLHLSGHTHGGQLFFLEPLMRALYGFPTGLSSHSGANGESLLFVTTGIGFSKLPVRLLVPPEIVVVDLVRSQ